jgi:hypothetical protein
MNRFGPRHLKPACRRALQTQPFPLILALILTLMVSDWVVAGAAARNMISERFVQHHRCGR